MSDKSTFWDALVIHQINMKHTLFTVPCGHSWTVENAKPVLRWGWGGSIRKCERIACWSGEMNE